MPSAPTIHRARTNAPSLRRIEVAIEPSHASAPASSLESPRRPIASSTPSREIPATGACQSNSTPQLLACSTSFACSATRRIPIAHSAGNRAATSLSRPTNRTPRITCPSPAPTLTPNSRSAATVSGISPSPHAFSIGHRAPSATTTRNPFLRAAIAAASPAGPPPITNTSVCSIIPSALNCVLSAPCLRPDHKISSQVSQTRSSSKSKSKCPPPNNRSFIESIADELYATFCLWITPRKHCAVAIRSCACAYK